VQIALNGEGEELLIFSVQEAERYGRCPQKIYYDLHKSACADTARA
jgi:hypothetical protein